MVNTNPNIFNHVVELGSANTGSIYMFRVRAYNQAGYVDTNYVYIALASLPKKPVFTPDTIRHLTSTT